MNPEQIGQRAEEIFDNGLDCAESVLVALAEAMDIQSPLIPRIATGFCGGMARTGHACGAVTGAVMGLGLFCGRDEPDRNKDQVYGLTQKFVKDFIREFGTTSCPGLIGVDLNTDEGQEAFKARGLRKQCAAYTNGAARIAARLLVG